MSTNSRKIIFIILVAAAVSSMVYLTNQYVSDTRSFIKEIINKLEKQNETEIELRANLANLKSQLDSKQQELSNSNVKISELEKKIGELNKEVQTQVERNATLFKSLKEKYEKDLEDLQEDCKKEIKKKSGFFFN